MQEIIVKKDENTKWGYSQKTTHGFENLERIPETKFYV